MGMGAGSLQSCKIISSQVKHNYMCQITHNVECGSGINWITGGTFSQGSLM